MNLWDILILMAVAVMVILALVRIHIQKRSGRSCCGTSSCCGHCESCHLHCSKKE